MRTESRAKASLSYTYCRFIAIYTKRQILMRNYAQRQQNLLKSIFENALKNKLKMFNRHSVIDKIINKKLFGVNF